MTLDEFLAWEERQELRWEFDGFEPVAMAGGTIAQSTIHRNLITSLNNRLRGNGCRAHGSDIKIEVAGSIRYPDVLVLCSPQVGSATIAKKPVVVFEIVSPSSSRTDRIVKAREYGNTDSIHRYVIMEQTSQAATVFTRIGDTWAGVVVDGDVELAMPEIGTSVPLSELYEDVEFPAEDAA